MSEGIAEYRVTVGFAVRLWRRECPDEVTVKLCDRQIGTAVRRPDGSTVVRSSGGSLLMVGGDELSSDERLVRLLVGQLGIEDGEVRVERRG